MPEMFIFKGVKLHSFCKRLLHNVNLDVCGCECVFKVALGHDQFGQVEKIP